jgi:hypothetical protein
VREPSRFSILLNRGIDVQHGLRAGTEIRNMTEY